MKNLRIFNNIQGIEIKMGEAFKKLSNNEDVIGFFDETCNFYSLDVFSDSNKIVYPVKRKQLIFNLINYFSCYFNVKIVDFFVDLSDFWLKFDTKMTYSESNFDIFNKDILNLFNNNELKIELCDEKILNNSAAFLNHIPFDFKFEKIAQEDFNGIKVQKFTVAVFFNDDEKKDYEERIAKLKLIDHRYIGVNQSLFMMIPESPGSVFWLPKGWKIYRNLEKFIRKYGYQGFNEVRTPIVMSNKFWIKSGHMTSFKQNMMFVNMGDSDEHNSALKPMNCPGHIEIFKQKNRSYKELPYRMAEFGCCHRYEPSGALHGLMRVRSLTQDDGHIFCTREQIHSETLKFLTDCIEIYNKLGFDDVKIILSTKPSNALGDPEDWEIAESYLKDSLNKLNLDFEIAEGDGAFYGPKIEMHVKDSLKRSWQLGTIQLDFVLPERFEIGYTKSDDTHGNICMLHRAILGSLERFIGVLLEHTKGKLPLFLAPVQINICTIVSDVNDYARKVYDKLNSFGLSVELDDRPEKIQAKIRNSIVSKIPMIIVLGKNEMNDNIVKVQYNNESYNYKFEELEGIMRFFNEN